MALRRIAPKEWRRRLRAYKCNPLEGKGKLNTAEWWCNEWLPYPFAVPVEADGYIDALALDRLILGLIQTCPADTVFDHSSPEEGDGDNIAPDGGFKC